ncbi:hypothetical protein QFZ94_008333 [Paraburkholderia sp. JPY465]
MRQSDGLSAHALARDLNVQAATREKTRRSYQSALRQFEVEWGSFLPASADMIARYLADHAETLSINTLRSRLAALAQWHQTQGFPDPTKAPHVRKVLRGIVALHPATEKRAKPMQLAQLEKLTAWLDEQIVGQADERERLACIRNRALVLLGFWRGFRSDELSRLRIEHVAVEAGRGMTLYLPRTKRDRAQLGTTFKAPALSRLCPVTAYEAWIAASGLTEGPVFRSIDRWGNISDEGLHGGVCACPVSSQHANELRRPHNAFRFPDTRRQRRHPSPCRAATPGQRWCRAHWPPFQ